MPVKDICLLTYEDFRSLLRDIGDLKDQIHELKARVNALENPKNVQMQPDMHSPGAYGGGE